MTLRVGTVEQGTLTGSLQRSSPHSIPTRGSSRESSGVNRASYLCTISANFLFRFVLVAILLIPFPLFEYALSPSLA